MKISLIISFYKRIDFLELILMSLEKQVYKNFEAIIAEDDNFPGTKLFLKNISPKFSYKISHVFQEADNGFKKNEMLNKAICLASGEFIIVIDGDCVLHHAFIKEYANALRDRTILFGRRAMLSEKVTKDLLLTKNFWNLNIINLILKKSSRVEEVFYLPWLPGFLKKKKKSQFLLGSNMGFLKKDIIDINGFDEDYVKPSLGEDTDIEWRFKTAAYQFSSMKFRALQYHLYHPVNYSKETVDDNFVLLTEKMKSAHIFCVNGINKYVNRQIDNCIVY